MVERNGVFGTFSLEHRPRYADGANGGDSSKNEQGLIRTACGINRFLTMVAVIFNRLVGGGRRVGLSIWRGVTTIREAVVVGVQSIVGVWTGILGVPNPIPVAVDEVVTSCLLYTSPSPRD